MKTEPFYLSDFSYEAALDLIEESANGRITFAYGQKNLHADLKPNPFLKDYTPDSTRRYFMDENRASFLTINDRYATLQCRFDETDYALVAYCDKAQNKEIKRLYDEMMPVPTLDSISFGTSENSLLLNITEMVKANPLKGVYGSVDCCDMIPQNEGKEKGKGNIVMLHILKDCSQYPMEHEVDWQLNNLHKSLDFLNQTYWGLYWYEKEFRGQDHAKQTLHAFRDWVKSNFSLADYDLFYLVRWGQWKDGYIGYSYVNVYDVNKYKHEYAYGVTASTCLYPWVFGHEVGHIFGAEHVQDNKDIMYPSAHIMCTGRHRNRSNIDKIKKNGTYIPD